MFPVQFNMLQLFEVAGSNLDVRALQKERMFAIN
jgi:hypothetical protein